MLPWLGCGNPSSQYEEGRRAKAAIDRAREQLSGVLGCLFAEVVFTSSGTEAANLALIGAAVANEQSQRSRILIGAAEHHCVLHTVPLLERLGYRVDMLPVSREGQQDLSALETSMGDDVLLLSIMHANNEMGTINPVSEAVSLAHCSGALVHIDAVQTFRSLPWSVDDLGADLITLSAHKIGGPKGSGALYVRAGTRLKPLVYGGGQERELRGGTENVAAIVGFGAAVTAEPPAGLEEMRDWFETALVEAAAVQTVPTAPRLPGHCHVRFPCVSAETLLILLDRLGVSASSGAACSSGSIEPSHVLLACGYTAEEAKHGVRFTFGRGNTLDEARRAADTVINAVRQIQSSGGKPLSINAL